jgi:hypothetical protein
MRQRCRGSLLGASRASDGTIAGMAPGPGGIMKKLAAAIALLCVSSTGPSS